jgi:hypothetical protein
MDLIKQYNLYIVEHSNKRLVYKECNHQSLHLVHTRKSCPVMSRSMCLSFCSVQKRSLMITIYTRCNVFVKVRCNASYHISRCETSSVLPYSLSLLVIPLILVLMFLQLEFNVKLWLSSVCHVKCWVGHLFSKHCSCLISVVITMLAETLDNSTFEVAHT